MVINFVFRNALNIVKDDLIVKVDELAGEIEILREEMNTANQARSKLRQRVSELEDELKQNKTIAKAHSKSPVHLLSEHSMLTRILFQTTRTTRTRATCRWRSASDSLAWRWLEC